MLKLTYLQISAFSFLIPFYAAYKKKLYNGALIYFLNFCTSILAHRKNRLEEEDISDYLDYNAILLWSLYNIYLTINGSGVNCLLSILAGFMVILTQIIRFIWEWRSPKRNITHAIMHFAGAFGSLAAIKCVKNN